MKNVSFDWSTKHFCFLTFTNLSQTFQISTNTFTCFILLDRSVQPSTYIDSIQMNLTIFIYAVPVYRNNKKLVRIIFITLKKPGIVNRICHSIKFYFTIHCVIIDAWLLYCDIIVNPFKIIVYKVTKICFSILQHFFFGVLHRCLRTKRIIGA